jgi:nitrate reductase NapAB chaperone NapD
MPVCGYVVVPRPSAKGATAAELASMEGCDVYPAEQGDLLLLVTSTGSLQEEDRLRRRVEDTEGVQALLLAFGEIDPDTAEADPAESRP